MNGSDHIKYTNWINIWAYYSKTINTLKLTATILSLTTTKFLVHNSQKKKSIKESKFPGNT